MIHAHILGRRIKPSPATPVALANVAPFSPARYLRVRRAYAGLSIQQVAERIAPRETDRAEAADLVRMLETEGVTAREPATLKALRNVYPFDLDVYRQLTNELDDRHPAICQECGCSAWDRNQTDDRRCTCSTDTTSEPTS